MSTVITIVEDNTSITLSSTGPQGAQGADSTVPGPTGPRGLSGITTAATAPSDTSVVWLDTSAAAGIPNIDGGTA
jgi:hypothetical protein